MAKVDFKRELKHLYRPSKAKFTIVDVPEMNFLMIDGRGDPNTAPAYQAWVTILRCLLKDSPGLLQQQVYASAA